MKEATLSQTDKIMLRKKVIVECVHDELKNLCKLQRTRHRSVNNFLLNILGSIATCNFFTKKPSINIQCEQKNNQVILLLKPTSRDVMKKFYVYMAYSILLVLFSCAEEKKQESEEQHSFEKEIIDLQNFKKKELNFRFLDGNTKINVEYITLDTFNPVKLNNVRRCIIDNNYIYLLSGRDNILFIFGKDGSLISKHTNSSLNLGVISDFIVNNQNITILDGKKDIIGIFSIKADGKQLRKMQEIKPSFEMNSFWKLENGDFLATTSSWNEPPMSEELLKVDTDFITIKEGYYRNKGYADDNYLLGHSHFHSYNDYIYFTHSTENITFLFDKTGNVSEVLEIKHGDNAPKNMLSSLEKNAYQLSKYYFINDFIHIKGHIITGKIASGLSPKKSFIADTSTKTIYIEEKPFTSIFSNTIGSYQNKIISILIPGQYSFVKEAESINDDIKDLLNRGKYVICLIEL